MLTVPNVKQVSTCQDALAAKLGCANRAQQALFQLQGRQLAPPAMKIHILQAAALLHVSPATAVHVTLDRRLLLVRMTKMHTARLAQNRIIQCIPLPAHGNAKKVT